MAGPNLSPFGFSHGSLSPPPILTEIERSDESHLFKKYSLKQMEQFFEEALKSNDYQKAAQFSPHLAGSSAQFKINVVHKIVTDRPDNATQIFLDLMPLPHQVAHSRVLSVAARQGNVSLIRRLIEPFYQVSSEHRFLAIDIAITHGHYRAVEALIQNQMLPILRFGSSIGLAAERGNLAILQLLLAHGQVYPRARESAVMSAAERGYTEIVRALLNDGPITDRVRRLSIGLAREHDHDAVATLLIETFPEQPIN